MKIIKKITFRRAKSLSEEFKLIQEKFLELKNEGDKEGIERISSAELILSIPSLSPSFFNSKNFS